MIPLDANRTHADVEETLADIKAKVDAMILAVQHAIGSGGFDHPSQSLDALASELRSVWGLVDSLPAQVAELAQASKVAP